MSNRKSAERFVKVSQTWFVAFHLFGSDDRIEVNRQMLLRFRE